MALLAEVKERLKLAAAAAAVASQGNVERGHDDDSAIFNVVKIAKLIKKRSPNSSLRCQASLVLLTTELTKC